MTGRVDAITVEAGQCSACPWLRCEDESYSWWCQLRPAPCIDHALRRPTWCPYGSGPIEVQITTPSAR